MEHEVALTNLDGPLFDGAEATKGDLVAYLDAVADRLLIGLARPAALGDAGAAGAAPVHAEEPAEVRAGLDRDGRDLGRDLQARSSLRALQRPLDAALVRQPARGRVPPDARPSPDHLVLDLDPPAGAAFSVVAQTALLVREALAARDSPAR